MYAHYFVPSPSLSLTHISQGSQAQLEEVWKDEDGLKDEQFDPKVFFRIHGKGQFFFFHFKITIIYIFYISINILFNTHAFLVADVNDDGFLDLKEIEALFMREARTLHE